LSLIGSRQYAFHRAIDKPCAIKFIKGWLHAAQNDNFYILALPFISSLQVIVVRRHFKFNMWVEHSLHDKPSLKWAWRGHVTSNLSELKLPELTHSSKSKIKSYSTSIVKYCQQHLSIMSLALNSWYLSYTKIIVVRAKHLI